MAALVNRSVSPMHIYQENLEESRNVTHDKILRLKREQKSRSRILFSCLVNIVEIFVGKLFGCTYFSSQPSPYLVLLSRTKSTSSRNHIRFLLSVSFVHFSILDFHSFVSPIIIHPLTIISHLYTCRHCVPPHLESKSA